MGYLKAKPKVIEKRLHSEQNFLNVNVLKEFIIFAFRSPVLAFSSSFLRKNGNLEAKQNIRLSFYFGPNINIKYYTLEDLVTKTTLKYIYYTDYSKYKMITQKCRIITKNKKLKNKCANSSNQLVFIQI